MAPTFYAQDICSSIEDPTILGTVERTHSDVDTHLLLNADDYLDNIEPDGVSDEKFKTFLLTGIPPKDTVFVTWNSIVNEERAGSSLVATRLIDLVDRTILIGDIVKKKATDAQTGVVTHIEQRTVLFPPKPWPPIGSSSEEPNDELEKDFNVLMGVPSHELRKPCTYEEEDIIIYNGWVGRVEEITRDVVIRLPNGTVVMVNENKPGLTLMDRCTGMPTIGDPITCTKACLRTGKWIFGQYDANQEPEGCIADVRANEILVQWLKRKYGPEETPQPDELLSGSVLENDSILIYDRAAPPRNGSVKRVGLETGVGDSVRFADIDAAAAKYNDSLQSREPHHVNKVQKIPRTETLGYDINIFTVVRTMTKCEVFWQDCSASEHFATEIVPSQDLDDEDNVWPGEVVFPRQGRTAEQTVYTPEKAGVVVKVNAEARIATVNWMPNSSCSFAIDGDQEQLLPGSRTGPVGAETEEVSLYDIWTLRGFSRRLGDFVVIVPPQYDMKAVYGNPIRKQLMPSFDPDPSQVKWVGEVVELGLDGLLSVRLGAASEIRDIKVPWECTELAYSSDWTSSEVGELANSAFLSEDEDEDDDSDQMSIHGILRSAMRGATWRDENNEEIEMDDDWESLDGSPPVSNPGVETRKHSESNVDMTDVIDSSQASTQNKNLLNDQVGSRTGFSYADMFHTQQTDDSRTVAQFEIVEESPPSDHHWSSYASENEAKVPFSKLNKEHQILQSSLPPGVYVRTWETALHLMRVLILGPLGTPYEYAPFVFDILLDSSYPTDPPRLFFHSWTNGTGPVNPNLYEDGKVCLSLLGTWTGSEKGESWTSKSTILQLLVSLLGLVLVKEPWYNEAGFEVRSGMAEYAVPSAMYSEKAFFKSRDFIPQIVTRKLGTIDDIIRKLYFSPEPEAPRLLLRATASAMLVMFSSTSHQILTTAKQKSSGIDWPLDISRKISAGAVIPLKRQIKLLLDLVANTDNDLERTLRVLLDKAPNESEVRQLYSMLQ